MDQFSSILLKMDPLYPHRIRFPIVTGNLEKPVLAERQLILRYLITLRQVGVKIILSGKSGMAIDHAIQRKTGSNGIFNGPPVQNRECPRLTGTDRTDLGIGRGIIFHKTITEKFCTCFQLHVCFKTYYWFIFHPTQSLPDNFSHFIKEILPLASYLLYTGSATVL
jgi:hypothetical protein